jgi:hypothetical protein
MPQAKTLKDWEVSALGVYECSRSIRKAADDTGANYRTLQSFVGRMKAAGIISKTGRVDWAALGVDAPAVPEPAPEPVAAPVAARAQVDTVAVAEFSPAELVALHQLAAREMAAQGGVGQGEQVMLNVRVSQGLRDRLKAKSESVGSSVSAVLVGLIEHWLAGGKAR